MSLARGPYDGPIVVPDGVSIIGGFTQQWSHDLKSRSKLVTKTATQGHIVGVYAKNISRETLVAYWDVRTENAEVGANNYGVYVHTAPSLILRQMTVRAGRAGHGVAGEAGTDGAAAQPGDDGRPGLGNGTTNSGGACIRTPILLFSRGGFGGVGCQAGGTGGFGACYTVTSGGQTNDIAATDGEASLQVLGGEGGSIINLRDGKDGQDAPAFLTPANHGIGGEVSNGTLIDGHWVPALSAAGTSGVDGKDAPGGGGGGGAWRGDVDMSTPRNTPSGPGGGGGGGGGCGGTAGGGGTSGMGSFGLFVSSSEGLLVADSIFESSRGGDGGDGADGGKGGKGGKGGLGGRQVCRAHIAADGGYLDCIPSKHFGGDGGDGADGQDGGHGGGGAGGPSFGAFCAGTTIDTEGQVTFLDGGGGSGGRAGGPGATPGQDGVSFKSFQCVNE